MTGCPCDVKSSSWGLVTLSISKESMLEAAEVMLEQEELLIERTSASLTVPADAVLLCWAVTTGLVSSATDCWAASSMLKEAFSNCAVMSSKDTLPCDSLVTLPDEEDNPFMVLCLVEGRLAGGFWALDSVARHFTAALFAEWDPMLLSSCSMEQRSAMRASRSTVSPWFRASATNKSFQYVQSYFICLRNSSLCVIKFYSYCKGAKEAVFSFPYVLQNLCLLLSRNLFALLLLTSLRATKKNQLCRSNPFADRRNLLMLSCILKSLNCCPVNRI